MPSRFVSLAILIYWSIAAFCLLTWDVLPELTLGICPGLAVDRLGRRFEQSRCGGASRSSMIPRSPDMRRTVGEAVTGSSRRPDGWFELTSQVEFDAGGPVEGDAVLGPVRAFGSRSTVVYRSIPPGTCIRSTCEVKSQDSAETLVEVKGQLKGKKMEIVSRGRWRS